MTTAVKISEMNAVTVPVVTDKFAVVDVSSDETKQITLAQVRSRESFSWANLPDAADYIWQLVAITDDDSDQFDNGGNAIVYSDGVVWRYAADGSLVKMEDILSDDLSISSVSPSIVDTTNLSFSISPYTTSLSISTTPPTIS